jgi:hypothetical protein
MAQILNLNKTRLFKTFNQNCSCLDAHNQQLSIKMGRIMSLQLFVPKNHISKILKQGDL